MSSFEPPSKSRLPAIHKLLQDARIAPEISRRNSVTHKPEHVLNDDELITVAVGGADSTNGTDADGTDADGTDADGTDADGR